MADESAPENGASAAQNQSTAAVLVDAEVDGARYLLVRMPKSEDPSLPAPLCWPGSHCNVGDDPMGERRRKFGNFRRILVVDAGGRARLRLVNLLHGWGFSTITASEGNEALKVFERQQSPDLVIVNHSLPGMSGIELCRHISAQLGEHAPHILMMGRRSGRQHVVESLESGAAEYLSTPFGEQELRARLVVAVRRLARQDRLIDARDQLRDQAARDALTGVWNRRGILEILQEQLLRAEREVCPAGVLMLDLDHFKCVNDLYGHLVGDLALQETARRLAGSLRVHEFLGRYGGEEFLIVVPATDENELCEIANRIRAVIEAKAVHADLHDIQITASIGAAISKPGGQPAEELIASADRALYKAKHLGRNRVVVSC